MMGDGVIDIAHIRGLIERAGYAGLVEVEIFSAGQLVEAPDARNPRNLP